MKQLKLLMFLAIIVVAGMIPSALMAQEYHQGVIQLKFKKNQTSSLQKMLLNRASKSGELKRTSKRGFIETGLKKVDEQNKQFKVHAMKRVFRPAGKFEDKHVKAGLHLWYELKFDTKMSLKSVVNSYKKITEVELVNPIEKIKSPSITALKEKSKRITRQEKKLKANSFPNDPLYAKQWHYHNTGQSNGTPSVDIDLERAWNIQKGDSRVIVAVTDHSVDPNHEDLKGNMWVNSGEIPGNNIDDDNNGFVDDIHGYDFFKNSGTLDGNDRHGNHVAGTISAETNNGIGVAGIAGGTGNNDGVRIMSVGVFGKRGSGGFAEGYVYAADNGAVISQNSWNSVGTSSASAERDAIDYFIANAGGVDKAMNGGVVIFSMGNDHGEVRTNHATYAPVIAVCATDENDERGNYSNYGNWAGVSAPGGAGGFIDGEWQFTRDGVWSSVNNNEYREFSGTSMAAPHVSGIAALLVSNNYGSITPQQVRKIIEGTTEFIDYKNSGVEGKLGVGRVNAYEALRVAENMHIPILVRANNTTTNSTTITWGTLNSDNEFEVAYKKVSATSWVTSITNGLSFKINNLEEGEWYDVKVRAKNSAGYSPYSGTSTFITKVSSLAVPSNFTISNIKELTADLSWERPKHVLTYLLRYRVVGNSKWEEKQINLGNTKSLVALFPKTKYELQIKAKSGGVESDYTPVQSFTTLYTKCGEIEPWQPKGYGVNGTKVAYNGKIYANAWWAGPNDVPGKNSTWRFQGNCPKDNDNEAPQVTITSLSNGQVVEQETLSSITLSANATDSDGTIASIQFSVDGANLSSGNNISWLPSAFGSYTIKVEVTDDKGAKATDEVIIIVKEKVDNEVPQVTITSLSNRQVVEQETLSSIMLSANATDSDGTIESIQFSVDGTNLSMGNDISWLPASFKSYTIKVEVIDNKGAKATDEITITVKQKVNNEVPQVTITSLSTGQVIEQETLSSITLSANATDSDGTIASIQFSVDGVNLSSGNNISWLPASFKNYTIKVEVRDDKGAKASDVVKVTIKEKTTGGGCNSIQAWEANTEYKVKGTQVAYKGSVYENKWWTKNEEPGAGGPWGPWKLIGACIDLATINNLITIAPNPTQGVLKLHLESGLKQPSGIKISSLTGKYNLGLDKNLEKGELIYDISRFPKGVYLLEITIGKQVVSKKIILE
ncbi:S8 family serine peptidase [Tenacibaculum sp. 190524A02b]|uniref:S8 family serine peptidase n=1 Tax=Tenacibaculum vairaonense TaxID=3137860 RepID=A0ABM9PSF6_9FLAO